VNIFTFTTTALLLTVHTAAFAQWSVNTKGPDVFNEKSAQLFGDISGGEDFLVFKCTSSGELSAQWLIRANEVSRPRVLDGVIILRADLGEPVTINGTLQAWNDKYVALVSTSLSEIFSALAIISNAIEDVSVGYIMPEADIKDSGNISATGLIRSVSTFMSHCSIGGWGNLQHPAHRLDPIHPTVFLNESSHLRNGRSSSAWAK